ncbi:hypothetical protein C0992_009022 [Termitomyces sp. T32_za158]|nr:hypothetical protein C0992_009022 [Termitomyces sp. T32_za158]
MDSWPAAERARTTESLKRRKRQKPAVGPYPEVDVGAGGPNVVTLLERDGRFEWTFLVQENNQATPLRPSKHTTIFPATRPPPDPSIKSTILQKAERGANFLRTYLPDVDIPAELIRDELSQDAKITESLEKFDPYTRNILQPVVAHESAYLAFPMGELNCDLNISPFVNSRDGIVFKPSAHPLRTFKTPIQQITTTVPGIQAPYIAVRTFGHVNFLQVDASSATPCLSEVAALLPSETGGRAVVDVVLSATPFSSLVVNDLGSVYQCNIIDGDKTLDLIHPGPTEGRRTPFWRLARGTADTNYLLASEHSLSQIDIRADESIDLFSLTAGTSVVTSIEDQGDDNILKLCTTNELVWIDARFTRKPLLAYKHGRQYDRSLEARTSPLSSGTSTSTHHVLYIPSHKSVGAVTLLTSSSNSLVTLYDVSRAKGQPIHINAPSYCFFSDNDAFASYTGSALFSHPLRGETDAFSLVRLTKRGSLHKVDVGASEGEGEGFGVSWDDEVKDLEAMPLRVFEPPYADQAFVELDLSSVYNHILCLPELEREKREEENADAVYNLLEVIPTVWQGLDAPIEHVLTTRDAVLRAGDEPTQTYRADFLTDCVINSTRGYRALTQGRLDPNDLVKGSSWHKNLTATLQRLDPTFPDDARSGAEAFKKYDLAKSPERSAESFRYEKAAREELALDLALSADVFSLQAFSRASDEGPALEDLTQTLSLASEPPEVHFGYLRPKAKEHYSREETDESEASMGVRSLLKDWQVGADPGNYVFVDHYGGSTCTSRKTRRTSPAQVMQLPFGTQSQRPPTILAASTVPRRLPEPTRRTVAQSQPDPAEGPSRAFGFGSQMPLSSQPQTQSSQEYMMSTQVLPGAYGGRPVLPKKKATTKKRVGGF